LFVVELPGDHTDLFRKNVVAAHGIDIDLRGGEPDRQRLVLTLKEQIDRDLFEGFCSSLVSALERATDPASSLAVTLAHLRRWKTFLSGRTRHLSDDEVRGLSAELIFLQELIERRSSRAAVEAWRGPEQSHQDFLFGNTAVEVKSLGGAERSAVRISSEDQLESLKGELFLRIYRLTSLPDAPSARSLNELVAGIQARIRDAETVELFDRKLAAHGYAPVPYYDDPHFVISDSRSYRVSEPFPRLVRSQLPTGITRVAYDIRLETIAPYECDSEALFWSC
jgi:hypothetical protein